VLNNPNDFKQITLSHVMYLGLIIITTIYYIVMALKASTHHILMRYDTGYKYWSIMTLYMLKKPNDF